MTKLFKKNYKEVIPYLSTFLFHNTLKSTNEWENFLNDNIHLNDKDLLIEIYKYNFGLPYPYTFKERYIPPDAMIKKSRKKFKEIIKLFHILNFQITKNFSWLNFNNKDNYFEYLIKKTFDITINSSFNDDKNYDIITSFMSLYNIQNNIDVIDNLLSKLNSKGILIIKDYNTLYDYTKSILQLYEYIYLYSNTLVPEKLINEIDNDIIHNYLNFNYLINKYNTKYKILYYKSSEELSTNKILHYNDSYNFIYYLVIQKN